MWINETYRECVLIELRHSSFDFLYDSMRSQQNLEPQYFFNIESIEQITCQIRLDSTNEL